VSRVGFVVGGNSTLTLETFATTSSFLYIALLLSHPEALNKDWEDKMENQPEGLAAKLARLIAESKVFKSEKDVSSDGAKLRVFPVERVIKRAEEYGITLSANKQHMLASYQSADCDNKDLRL